MAKYVDAEKLKELISQVEKEFIEKSETKGYTTLEYRHKAEGLHLALQFIDSLHQEQPLLPANLDDAAEEYGNKEFPDEPALGQWGTGDYEPPVDNEYPREIAKDAFIAGVEWMTGQGASFNTKVGWIDGPTILDWPDDILDKFEVGDEVIVQIRKKGKD